MASIFKKRILKDRLDQFSIPNMEAKLAILQKWHQAYKDGYLEKKGEKEAEQEFIQQIFVEVLEHTRFPDNPYTIIPQGKTMTSGQKPDAILGYFENDKEPEKLAAVCEIKDCNTPLDRSQKREGNLSPIQQAFKYKTQYQSCDFVIATNFIEIRLLKDNELNFEKWSLESLVDPSNDYFEFKKFYYLLCRKNLIASRGKSVTLQLLSDIQVEQEAITKEFYKLYKELRQKLIKNIWKNNAEAKKKSRFYELAVEKAQKIIDRIVFIAFCEDLGLLPENILQKVVESDNQSFGSTWNTLKGFFTAVDIGSTKLGNADGYNGELFKPDADLDKLIIDDEICHEFLKIGLYDFSEDLSVNILGHIFEQSISDLEDLKNVGEEVDKENTTSKRKKDGIFYTPEYIVDYIVQNSVGAWLKEQEENILGKHNVKEELEDKNYKKRYREAYEEYQIVLQNIKVLDPACGSGAFLVKVFDFLLEENKRVSDIVGNIFGLEEFFRSILQNNIYGVDLNPESVEITKLSLWLKTAQKGKKLTTLKNNVKCGNSLIDDPTVAGDRAFKWEEAFKEIVDEGGFDVVVGNPPWVFARGGNFTDAVKEFFYKKYRLANYQLNTYLLFFEQGFNLLKPKGGFSFIVPNTCLTIDTFEPFRKFLLSEVGNLAIVNIYGQVFEGASVDSCIVSFTKTAPKTVRLSEMRDGSYEEVGDFPVKELAKGNHIINIGMMKKPEIVTLMAKIEKTSTKLKDIARPSTGVKVYQVGKGKPIQTKEIKDSRAFHSKSMTKPTHTKYLEGRDVGRYSIGWSGEYLDYGDWIAEPRNSIKFDEPRILVRQIPSKPPFCINAVYTMEDYINDINSMVIVDFKISPLFILGAINSRLTSFWFLNKFDKLQRGVFPQFKVKELALFPIPKASDSQRQEIESTVQKILDFHIMLKSKTDQLTLLVKTEFSIENWSNRGGKFWVLDFNDFLSKLGLTKLPLTQKDDLLQLWNKYVPELQEIDLKIKQFDQEIDDMVFDLYELTEEERRIVLESATSNA